MAERAVDTDGASASPERKPAADRPALRLGPTVAGGLGDRTVIFAVAAATGIGFVGRRRELAALRADISRVGLDTISGRKPARGRVLLIAGRPGSGRTSLAEELALRLTAEYPDGVLRARLSTPDGEPVPVERVARELLAALGVGAVAGAEEDELTEALRRELSGRRALLLLDDAPGADPVDALLPDEPDCLVLAVSRGPLTGIPDVRPCTVGGLDLTAAVGLLGQYTGATRITNDPVAAESLVEECLGQPAALALVGGWLAARPDTSVAEALRRLREQESPDDGQDRGGWPLNRAFRLAYRGLSPAAARLLRLLVLAPGCSADTHLASALAGWSVPEAEAALETFAAHGLLHSRGPWQYELPGCLTPMLTTLLHTDERPAELRLARARMLERTARRLYACRLAGEPDEGKNRGKLAELPKSLRFSSRTDAGAWLRARLPALLASIRLAAEDGELDTLARRLVRGLAHALTAHLGTEGAAPELYGLHQLMLDAAELREQPVEKAGALLNLGDLDASAGRPEEALARYRGALQAARAAADPYTTGRSLESIGATYHELGDWHRAADWYGRALELRLTRRELPDEARLYERLAAVHTRAGRWEEALRGWRAAAAARRRLEDLPAYAWALHETAGVLERTGRPREALRTCREAAECARRTEDTRLRAALAVRTANLLDELGETRAADEQRRAAEVLLARQMEPRTPPLEQPEHANNETTYEISSGPTKD